jgi:hypothetical protein
MRLNCCPLMLNETCTVDEDSTGVFAIRAVSMVLL